MALAEEDHTLVGSLKLMVLAIFSSRSLREPVALSLLVSSQFATTLGFSSTRLQTLRISRLMPQRFSGGLGKPTKDTEVNPDTNSFDPACPFSPLFLWFELGHVRCFNCCSYIRHLLASVATTAVHRGVEPQFITYRQNRKKERRERCIF